MRKIPTPFAGLFLIEPRVFPDERGHFFEAYHETKLAELGITEKFVQVNQSFSHAGVLRGLHFQKNPHAQSKIVRCLRGSMYDVVVDIRHGSPTYGKWYGVELSAENKLMMYVPFGFAHGFYALTDCEMMYMVGGGNWNKESESGIRYDDPAVGITWPVKGQPIVHAKDAALGGIESLTKIFEYTL
jgi:dTDP-4-dehydrorhamnose 3,5-epimerase